MQMNALSEGFRPPKVILVIFLTVFSIIASSTPLNQHLHSIKVVVIDAGHGGKDPGCRGHEGSHEKEITLAISKKLGQMIKDSFPSIKIVYTRETDRFIPLWQRAEIANQNKADLFVSIHCNAHTNKNLHGSETYVMGLHKSQGNLAVSKRENGSLKLEGDYGKSGHYGDFDPNSPEAHIILSLYQNAFLESSIGLARKVQDEVKTRGKLADLGVKQAGFVVLWKTTMPSILIETGYLSNPSNEKYLKSENGQTESATNIFEAIKTYKEKLEKR